MSRNVLCWTAALALVVAGAPLAAETPAETPPETAAAPQMSAEEQQMMAAYEAAGKPGDEHQQLASMAGKWNASVKMWMKPGDEPMTSSATVEREMMLDGRVLVERFSGSMMGQPFEGYGMTGYDNVSQRYWGTWNDSMSTALMVSQGTCDEATHVCTFNVEMTDPMTKEKKALREVIRHEGADTQLFEMYETHDGHEFRSMEITYTRAK